MESPKLIYLDCLLKLSFASMSPCRNQKLLRQPCAFRPRNRCARQQNLNGSLRPSNAKRIGSGGEPICPNGNGELFARTTRKTRSLGSICLTITPVRERTDGAKMACWEFPIERVAFAFLLLSGTREIQSSKSASTVSLDQKAITAKTSKSATTISTQHQLIRT